MQLADALREALTREVVTFREPTDMRAAARRYVREAGGTPAVARQELGLRADMRPRDMTARQRLAYETKRRQINRYITAGAERRATPPAFLQQLRQRVRRRIVDRAKIARLVRRGARARLRGLVRVSDDLRARAMPVGGPGVLIPGDVFDRAVAQPFLDDDLDRAAEGFAQVFNESYGITEDVELVDVHELKLWADGSREP